MINLKLQATIAQTVGDRKKASDDQMIDQIRWAGCARMLQMHKCRGSYIRSKHCELFGWISILSFHFIISWRHCLVSCLSWSYRMSTKVVSQNHDKSGKFAISFVVVKFIWWGSKTTVFSGFGVTPAHCGCTSDSLSVVCAFTNQPLDALARVVFLFNIEMIEIN